MGCPRGGSTGSREPGTRAFACITRAIRNSIGVAERLAEYARLEREDPSLSCVRIALIELVGQLVEETRVTALQRGFRLSALLTSGVPAIVGDPVQLHRALSNLLLKVARTTAPGGELYVAVAPSGSTALITIRSTGCGVDLGLQQQGSDSSAPAGTLESDLAQARRCLERHGATVQTQAARPDRQFCIEISFPRLTMQSGPVARVNSPGPGAVS